MRDWEWNALRFIFVFEKNMIKYRGMRRKTVWFSVIFLSIFLFGFSGRETVFVVADTLDDKKDDLQDLQEKKSSYQKIIDIKKNQKALLQSQITNLAQQTDTLSSTIAENTVKLEETKQKIQTLEQQIQEKEEVIAEQKEMLADFIRSYRDSESGGFQAMVFAVESGENPFSSADQSEQFQSDIAQAVEKIEAVRRSLSRDSEALGRDKTETETLNARLEQQTAYLDSAKQQKEALAEQAVVEQTQYEKKLSKVEEQIDDIEQEIEELEAQKSNSLDLSKLPSRSGAAMRYPLEKGSITQGYGKTSFAKSSKMYKNGFHNGVDFGVPTGTEVLAAASGTVVATGNSGRYAYGKWIAIDHGNGLVTLYGHLSKQKVSRGDGVSRGDTIGLSGNTGNSTGPHVHFTVFSEDSFEVVDSVSVSGVKIPTGASVNPMRYL